MCATCARSLFGIIFGCEFVDVSVVAFWFFSVCLLFTLGGFVNLTVCFSKCGDLFRCVLVIAVCSTFFVCIA